MRQIYTISHQFHAKLRRMQFRAIIDQLVKRRVFRTAVVYVASVWVLLQVADLFAGEAIIPDQWVTWLILASAVGFPLVLIGSWFLEAPWKARSRMSTAGDLFIIVAITLGAVLFAWQQWAISTTRTPIAIGRIVATDLQDETAFIATHLEGRFALLFDTNDDADYRLEGTVARSGDVLRLTTRLVDSDGRPLWSETFEDALVRIGDLQLDVVTTLAAEMASQRHRIGPAERLIDACPYPANGDAIIALVDGREPELLAGPIQDNADNGLLYLQQARAWFEAIDDAAPHQRPVLFSLATQSLDQAKVECPDLEQIEATRVAYTERQTP
jgi:hypothetical protein